MKAESHMHFFTYNLKRVINIIGAEKLTDYFKTRILLLFFSITKNKEEWIHIIEGIQLVKHYGETC